jgi:uncharacterized protein (DUF2147 family)
MNKLAIIILSFTTLTVSSRAQDELSGIWLTEEGNSKVEIIKDGEKYSGTIVWLSRKTDKNGNPITDKNNPEKELRDRPIMGLEMLQDIQFENDKGHGTIYAPKRGMTLECELVVINDLELQVNVTYRGFTKKQIWTRSSL